MDELVSVAAEGPFGETLGRVDSENNDVAVFRGGDQFVVQATGRYVQLVDGDASGEQPPTRRLRCVRFELALDLDRSLGRSVADRHPCMQGNAQCTRRAAGPFDGTSASLIEIQIDDDTCDSGEQRRGNGRESASELLDRDPLVVRRGHRSLSVMLGQVLFRRLVP